MKLRKRQQGRTAQTLDTLAGVTKIWTELQIGKKASKGVAKATSIKTRQRSGLGRLVRSTPVRIAGAAAVVGGAGAAIAKKLKGSGPDPIYTPPPPGEPVAPPDVAPPLAVAPEPATPTGATMPQAGREPAIGGAGLHSGGADAPAVEPVAVEDAIADEPAAAASGDADAGAMTLDEEASSAGTIALTGDDGVDGNAAESPDATSSDPSAEDEDEDEIRRR